MLKRVVPTLGSRLRRKQRRGIGVRVNAEQIVVGQGDSDPLVEDGALGIQPVIGPVFVKLPLHDPRRDRCQPTVVPHQAVVLGVEAVRVDGAHRRDGCDRCLVARIEWCHVHT